MFLRHQAKQSKESAHPVEDVGGARVDHLDHDVGVEKIGGNHVWHKGRVFFLEHDGHDVISYVPLPLQLRHTQQRRTSDGSIQANLLSAVFRQQH